MIPNKKLIKHDMGLGVRLHPSHIYEFRPRLTVDEFLVMRDMINGDITDCKEFLYKTGVVKFINNDHGLSYVRIGSDSKVRGYCTTSEISDRWGIETPIIDGRKLFKL